MKFYAILPFTLFALKAVACNYPSNYCSGAGRTCYCDEGYLVNKLVQINDLFLETNLSL